MTLKLIGSSSGHTSIDAPATAGSNTLVLPPNNGTAGQILQTDGNGNLSWVTPGVAMADQWRRTATLNTSGGENFLTSDWERVDGSGQGTYIPDGGMSESGGIFTFPMTGIYKVEWQAYAEDTNASAVNAINIYITTDNSSYNARCSSLTSVPDISTYSYGNAHCQTFVDVTDVTQVKVRFRVYSNGTVAVDASSSENRNCATFIRLGDT